MPHQPPTGPVLQFSATGRHRAAERGKGAMRKIAAFGSAVLGILLSVAVAASANPVGIPGYIILTEDLYASDIVIDNPQGTVRVYVFLSPYFHGNAVGCSFAAPKPACFNAVYVGESQQFTMTLGDSQTGLQISFGACISSPRYLVRITYSVLGPTPECCIYWVRPHPEAASGHVEIWDCNEQVVYGDGGYLIFNIDASWCQSAVPAESSTWGKVKALYAQ